MPGANACVKSTNFLPASCCWIGQSESAPAEKQFAASKRALITLSLMVRVLTKCSGRSQQVTTTLNNKALLKYRRFLRNNLVPCSQPVPVMFRSANVVCGELFVVRR